LDDPHAFQEQFRIHRGTKMCRALNTNRRTGKLSSGQPGAGRGSRGARAVDHGEGGHAQAGEAAGILILNARNGPELRLEIRLTSLP